MFAQCLRGLLYAVTTGKAVSGMEFNTAAIKWLRKMLAVMKVVATAIGIAATALGLRPLENGTRYAFCSGLQR